MGAAHDDAGVRRQLAGDEGGILEFADADGEVVAVANDVDEVVGQMHVELDFRKAGQELGQQLCNVEPAEGGRCRNFEHAARLGVAAGDEILGFFDQAQDVDNALEVAFARLGQGQLAGGALEQAGAQPLFEEADALGDDGRRKPHFTAGGRHVAGAGDACEDVEVTDRGHGFVP